MLSYHPIELLVRLLALTAVAGLRRVTRWGDGSSHGGPIGRDIGLMWSSFYNPWTGTISMWPGLAMSASSSCPHSQLS
jgi:hypothetical protein